MTAVAWRLFRAQAVWGAAALGVVGVVLLATGPSLAHVYDASAAACRSAGGVGPACASPTLSSGYTLLQNAVVALVLVGPAVLGIFWGAPLIAREFETGTFRLAWTQGVTRLRWLAVKVGLGGVASLAAGVALSLAATWWSAPVDAVNQNRFSPSVFQVHGIVPGGYALFAFTLGVTTGVLFRRVLPAMATTLVVFIAARYVTSFEVRPYLLPLAHLTRKLSPATFGISLSPSGASAVGNAPNLPNAWVISASIVDKAGRSASPAVVKQLCASLPGVGTPPLFSPHGLLGHIGAKGGTVGAVPGVQSQIQSAMSHCIANMGRRYHLAVAYQPAGHFWPIQILEALVFVVLSAGLFALCAWWVTRRLT